MNIQKEGLCIGCSGCASVCPKECISLEADDCGFFNAVVDETNCVGCMKCQKVCPLNGVEEKTWSPEAYAVQNTDESVRLSSSSGGVFAELARMILDDGGVVYGVEFSSEQKVAKYVAVTEWEELPKIQKSKYVQAYIGDVFRNIKEKLNTKKVLFCGTPCAIHGLVNFLGTENENLYTCDFICHGVPSPMVLRDYLTELERKNKSKLISVDFRPKTYGWSNHSLKVSFENGKVHDKKMMLDPYFKAFMADNMILNDSCYECEYIKKKYSDITLADFWGYRAYKDISNDEKGLSLVFCNTKKGSDLLNKSNALERKQISRDGLGYIFNKNKYGNAYKIKKQNFFNDYISENVIKNIEKNTAYPAYKEWIKEIVRRIKSGGTR